MGKPLGQSGLALTVHFVALQAKVESCMSMLACQPEPPDAVGGLCQANNTYNNLQLDIAFLEFYSFVR